MRHAPWFFSCIFLASLASAAPPAVPGSMSYQGVLLDAGGEPQTGNVDLTIRLYDAISGGTLLYKQTLANVALVDGVFSVTLGPSGQATDAPVNPLTTSFAAALANDLAATGTQRFLEVTVGAGGALPRTQLLAVPYALRSSHAASADEAATAGAVSGIPGAFLDQSFLYGNFDGSGPPNGDPFEGVLDTDGDGIANFVDPDNDNDSLNDGAEVGPSINLATPIVSGVGPPSALWSDGATLAVSGSNFEAGITVSVGDQAPAPQNLSPTGFDVTVGPSGKGVPVTVTRLNGESGTRVYGGFTSDQLHGLFGATSQIHLDAKGAQQVMLGGRYDSDGDGLVDANVGASQDQDATAWSSTGRLAKLSDNASGGPAGINIFTDNNDDKLFTPVEAIFVQAGGSISAANLLFRPFGQRLAAYFFTTSGGPFAVVAHDRDGLGGFTGTNEVVLVEPLVAPGSNAARVAVDSDGRVAFAYYDPGADLLRLAWDRSGDGDYTDTVSGNPELFTLAASPTVSCVGVAFDADGVLSAVYDAGAGPVLARDLDGDGDFDAAGESLSLAGAAAAGCDAAAGASRLAVVHDAGGALTLLVDRDGDGDFDGEAETRILGYPAAGPYAPLAVTISETGRAIVSTRRDLFLDVEP